MSSAVNCADALCRTPRLYSGRSQWCVRCDVAKASRTRCRCAGADVPMVVPVDERSEPFTGLLFGGKGLAGVIRPIFHCPEQRFRVRVVIRHPGRRERPEHTQFLQPALQRGGTHGVAVIGVQDQRLLSPLTDPLPQASPTHQIRSNGWILTLIHIPGHHFAAPDVDYQVEVQPDPTHAGGQIGDVPAPHLVRTCGPQPWN